MKSGMFLAGCAVVIMSAGCGGEKKTAEKSQPAGIPNGSYLLTSEPDGAVDVIATRKTAKNEDEVVVVGRIGGSKNPWIEGRAAFSIVDGSLKACSDIEGDNCPVPWDYCCETDKLPTATALVKIVDENGKLVDMDARELLKVKELNTVVVKGTAVRDEAKNLTILATGIYVKK